MKLLDDNLVEEAAEDLDRTEQMTMDDKEFLKSLEKMASELDGESEISVKEKRG